MVMGIFKDIFAKSVDYDNSDSGLAAENVQDAIDELQDSSEELESKIINLEDTNYVKLIWEEITGTTGQVTDYSPTTIDTTLWASSADNAEVHKVGVDGIITGESVYTSSEALVRAVVETNLDYTLSGLPTAARYAIVWKVKGTGKEMGESGIPSSQILDTIQDPAMVRDTTNTEVRPSYSGDALNMLDAYIRNLGYIDFSLGLSTAMQEGRLAYSDTEKTLIFGLSGGNVSYSLGQEMYIPRQCKNESGVNIKNGDLIYISGGSGVNAEITLASADDISTADRTLAMATEDIDNGSQGFCTTYGIVRGETLQPIDTSGGIPGQQLFLGLAGKFTTTKQVAPNRCVCVGIIFRSHASEGQVLVGIEVDKQQMVRDTTKESTGFTAPENVIVTYDSSARTITLTGTVNGYYKGEPNYDLESSWVSDPHPTDLDKGYFLIYNGTDFVWLDLSVDTFEFSELLIAFVNYGTNDKWGARECHGLLQWQAHERWHDVIGTTKDSGGGLTNYALNSTTAADRRPDIDASLIVDEDLKTTNSSLASSSLYTQFNLVSTGIANFTLDQTEIGSWSGNQPYWNEDVAGTWQQTLMTNNYRMSYWLLATPLTADATSQKYRYLWIQGQSQTASLAGQQALSMNDVSLGNLNTLSPEVIGIQQVIVHYLGGNVEIEEVRTLTGSKASQSSSTSGSGLTAVSHDATLIGLGTPSDVLGFNLANANTWTAIQTFSATTLLDGLISRTGNTSYGTNTHTHVNTGTSCTTGKNGFNLLYCYCFGGLTCSATSQYTATVGGRSVSVTESYSGGFAGQNINIDGGWSGNVGGYEIDILGNYSGALGGQDITIASDWSCGFGRWGNLSSLAHGSFIFSNASSFQTALVQPGVFYTYPWGNGTWSAGVTTADTNYLAHIGGDTRVDGNIDYATVSINTQTGTTYTILDSDSNAMITLDNASAITLTLPTITASFPTGFTCTVIQEGAGQVTFSGTYDSADSYTKTRVQYSSVTIINKSGTWQIMGDLTT